MRLLQGFHFDKKFIFRWFLLFWVCHCSASSIISVVHFNDDGFSQQMDSDINLDNAEPVNDGLKGKHLMVIPWSGVIDLFIIYIFPVKL